MLACAALAACGGGSDPVPPVVDNTVPASALASPAAFTSYVASLPASETAEPVDVNQAVPPTSETDEPRPI
jgi:hypothetical protein